MLCYTQYSEAANLRREASSKNDLHMAKRQYCVYNLLLCARWEDTTTQSMLYVHWEDN